MTTPLNQQQRRFANRDDALAAAAAIRGSATSSVLAPVPVLMHLSEQTIGAREQAAGWVKTQIGRLWASVNPYSDASVADFADQAAGLMKTAQDAAGRTAAVAQAQQLRSVGIDIGTPDPSLPLDVRAPAADIRDGQIALQYRPVVVDYANDDTAHVTVEDMSTRAIFERPAETFRYLRSIDDPTAAEQSQLRIATLVDDNLMLAQRFAQQEVLAQAVDLDKKGPKIIGYRRVIHPELSRTGTCGMCIAASTRIYYVEELLPLHTHCKCTVAAVTAEHDPGAHMNDIDLKQIYEHAGGTSAGHLKRTKYQVDEHGELGPVLVPKRAYKPQTKTGKPFQSSGTPRRELKRRRAALNT